MKSSPPVSFARGKGRLTVRLCAVPMGRDWCLVLTGGDTPHLGAAAAAPGGVGAGEGGGTGVSAIALPGHREGDLAGDLARKTAAAIGANVAVCCGIHLDRITPEEIQDALALCGELADDFVRSRKDFRANNI